MDVRKIEKSIYYAGVNDRVTQRFEGLWPLPYGVSYNTYIVNGSGATALIDCVELSGVTELIGHVSEITRGKGPDYLVVNHMEPDHSGGIPELHDRFPDMKIVGNRLTIGMIKGFYHLYDDDLFVEVSDGEEMSLGDVTLRFVTTPMVHWPETMMTFVPERHVLFTGDAFGCFGALNGGIVDDTTDCSIYLSEAYRYYACIVGKYGRFVQKAMEKTGSLGARYLCPTHGPVWHSQIENIIRIYDMLSRYDSEQGVTIVYGSMYGNTASVAEAVARGLAARGEKRIRVFNAAVADMSEMISSAMRYDTLIVGSATYSMQLFPPVETFLRALETREVKNKTFATFGSYTWAAAAPKLLKEFSARTGMEAVATLEMKQGGDAATLLHADVLADAVMDARRQAGKTSNS